MKILLATGIFRPEVGGPAGFIAEFARRMKTMGHPVTLITYSDKKTYDFDTSYSFPIIRVVRMKGKLGKILNYINYYRTVKKQARNHDFIFTVDWFSAGVPVMLAARSTGKKYAVRVGGGYLWEKYMSQNKRPVTLRQFYAQKLYRQYRLMFWLIRKVLRGASAVVFNSEGQRELYVEPYGLDPKKLFTVYNAIPKLKFSGLITSYKKSTSDRDKEFVYAGRFTRVKNADAVVRAFAEFSDKTFRLTLIGEGEREESLRALVTSRGLDGRVKFEKAMTSEALYKRIADSFCVMLPSWSDVSPNQVFECISLGIPVLVTKETFLPIKIPEEARIDPSRDTEITQKMNALLDPRVYKKLSEDLEKIRPEHTWDNVMTDYYVVFRNLI